MWCTAIWPRAPIPSPGPIPRLQAAKILSPLFPMQRVSLAPAGHARQWPRPPWSAVHSAGSSLPHDPGTNRWTNMYQRKTLWIISAGQSSVVDKISGQTQIFFGDIFHRYFSCLCRDISWSVFMDLCQTAVYPSLWFIYLFSIHYLTFLIFGFGWDFSAYVLHG